jgi:hypothetical protein
MQCAASIHIVAPLRRIRNGRVSLLVVALISIIVGCTSNSKPQPSRVSAPASKILFQPRFVWADGHNSLQGTGFFAKLPDAQVLGVSSAHFLEFNGPQLLTAEWLDVCDGHVVSEFESARGKPGRQGTYEPLNMRPDYLIIVPKTPPPAESLLEFDERNLPDIGEPVWLPDKNPRLPRGYRLVEGTVIEATYEYIKVQFDDSINPQSQSGSPVISQVTGKVLGTWAAGRRAEGRIFIYLAPANSILNAATRANKDYSLRDVVGKAPQIKS